MECLDIGTFAVRWANIEQKMCEFTFCKVNSLTCTSKRPRYLVSAAVVPDWFVDLGVERLEWTKNKLAPVVIWRALLINKVLSRI